jgi:hypothetical protein
VKFSGLGVLKVHYFALAEEEINSAEFSLFLIKDVFSSSTPLNATSTTMAILQLPELLVVYLYATWQEVEHESVTLYNRASHVVG